MSVSRDNSPCTCNECRKDPTSAAAARHAQMNRLAGTLDEKQRRLFAGFQANQCGRGGQKAIAQILGLSIPTVRRGQRELTQGRIISGARRMGGGRKRVEKKRRLF